MTAISQLKSASFMGISFPYTECEVTLSHRHHVHVYLDTPGGETQKLGRALYKYKFIIPAHDTLRAPYANFYSTRLPQLWALWETGVTGDLSVPSAGIVKAFVPDATRTIRSAVQSGESVHVNFLEDQATLFAFSALFAPSTDGLGAQLAAFISAAQNDVDPGLLERVALAVTSLIALRDGEWLARAVGKSADNMIALCEQVARVPWLQAPANFGALDLLLDLHLAAVMVREDARRRGRPLSTKVIPARMAPPQISAWLYGVTDRAGELLAINDWSSPFSVPRGALVRYYA